MHEQILKSSSRWKESLKVNKLDAARRQLGTAIRLWFEHGDPVSIHVLAFSAYEVIHAVFRKQGHHDLLYDSSLIKDEHRGDFSRYMKKNANFFKHALYDPNAEIELETAITDLFLIMSVAGLLRMRIELHELEMAFNFWNVVHNPHWYRETQHLANVEVPISELEDWKHLHRPPFLARCLKVIRSKGPKAQG